MKRRSPGHALVLAVVGVAAIGVAGGAWWKYRATLRASRTAAWIEALDPDAIARLGTLYADPRYDLTRLGKPVERIDPFYDYDFDRLARVERTLAGVDRRTALAVLFERVTSGAATHDDRYRALLRFLQRATYHHADIRPVTRDGERVSDPLVLLELNEMRSPHATRLAIDLWEAGGYEARGVDLAGHSVAEVRYDDAWHYFDAETSGAGLAARLPDGTIPSVRELSERPHLLDALPYRFEIRDNGRPRLASAPARSHHYFNRDHPADAMHYFRKKPDAYTRSRDYGWRSTISAPRDWDLGDDKARFQPGAVQWLAVTADVGAIEVRWAPARDWDDDLLGYRVAVGTAPRGWSYPAFAGKKRARPFWSSDAGWDPAMYDALYRTPPHDVGLFETTERTLRLARADLAHPGPYYVTVWAYDAYHERAGKTLYPMSNELRVP